MRGVFALVGIGIPVVAGAFLVGANVENDQGDGSASAATAPIIPVATATIVQRTIESTEEFPGTLGYAGEGVIVAGHDGVYTELPEVGDILTLGDEIYEVDGQDRSFLMYGKRPAWRPLSKQSPRGADIRQLERSLELLGVTPRGFEPDWRYREATKQAVRRWQRRTNQQPDGRIAPGEVTFLPGDVRITAVVPELGTRASAGSVLAYASSTDLVVTMDLEADRRDILGVGDAVTVKLPDSTESAGTVTEIESVAQTLPGASEPTVEVTIKLEGTAAVGDLDGAEVEISVVRETRPDVLTVPVDALLALREGGYALEMVADDGSTYLVAADIGLDDDAGVEVSGDFSTGDTVVVPA